MLLLLSHSCWILGLALLLASFSYHYEQAIRQDRPLTQQLAESTFEGVAWVGLVLIGLGVAGTSEKVWEAALWILLTLVSTWQAATFWWMQRRSLEDD